MGRKAVRLNRSPLLMIKSISPVFSYNMPIMTETLPTCNPILSLSDGDKCLIAQGFRL